MENARPDGGTFPPWLSWWGGFLGGPIISGAGWLTSEPGSLARSHAKAATLTWATALLFWAPFSAANILFGVGDPSDLIVGLVALNAVALIPCSIGTVQLRRKRSFLGREIAVGGLVPGQP